jgi:ABC-2 type transport system permease protein
LIAILGGGLVETGIQTLLSALAFRIRSTRSLKILVDGLINTLGPYPILIFGPVGAGLLTFVLPVAFIAYFPATVLIGRMQELMVPDWIAIGSPLFGPVLAWVAYRLFLGQARAYQNVGG